MVSLPRLLYCHTRSDTMSHCVAEKLWKISSHLLAASYFLAWDLFAWLSMRAKSYISYYIHWIIVSCRRARLASKRDTQLAETSRLALMLSHTRQRGTRRMRAIHIFLPAWPPPRFFTYFVSWLCVFIDKTLPPPLSVIIREIILDFRTRETSTPVLWCSKKSVERILIFWVTACVLRCGENALAQATSDYKKWDLEIKSEMLCRRMFP